MIFSLGRYGTVVLFLLFLGGAKATPYAQYAGGNRNKSQINQIQLQHILQSVQRRYAPDLSLAVFDISY